MGSKTRADAQLLEDLCTFLKGPGFLPWLPSHFRVSGMPLQYENSAHTAMQPQQNSRCSFPENPPHAEQHSFHENQECLYLAKSVTETAPVGTWEEIISDYFRTLIAFLQQQVMIRQLRFLLWTTAVSLKCPSLKSKEVPLHWLRVATHTQELAPRTASVARTFTQQQFSSGGAIIPAPDKWQLQHNPRSHSKWTTQGFSFGSMMNLMQEPQQGQGKRKADGTNLHDRART